MITVKKLINKLSVLDTDAVARISIVGSKGVLFTEFIRNMDFNTRLKINFESDTEVLCLLSMTSQGYSIKEMIEELSLYQGDLPVVYVGLDHAEFNGPFTAIFDVSVEDHVLLATFVRQV